MELDSLCYRPFLQIEYVNGCFPSRREHYPLLSLFFLVINPDPEGYAWGRRGDGAVIGHMAAWERVTTRLIRAICRMGVRMACARKRRPFGRWWGGVY